MSEALVFNLQRYCTGDGPGIRTTVFLKGCPLHCWWCHNPESRSPRPELTFAESRCIRCGACASACPLSPSPRTLSSPSPGAPSSPSPGTPGEGRGEGFLIPPDSSFILHPSSFPATCLRCGACADACPTTARELVGRTFSPDDLLTQILKDLPFFRSSAGGVTFSGGEPLLQHQFLLSILQLCRQNHLHTAVDTSGYAPWPHLESLIPFTNLFLYDIKLIDESAHLRHTGVSNKLILDNLRQLAQFHQHIWIRIPIIPAVNDTPDHMRQIADFLRPLPSIKRIDLLPYHPLGSHKSPTPHPQITPPTPDLLATLAACFQPLSIPTHIGP